MNWPFALLSKPFPCTFILTSIFVAICISSPSSAAMSSPVSEVVTLSSAYHYVFVYGTLKRGFRNHYNMQHSDIRYACSAVTIHKLPLYMDPLQRNRPCLANVKGVGHQVRGEVYRVTSEQLKSLDEFERVPTHYHRELLPLQVDRDCQGEERGRVLYAHVYFINVKEDMKQRIKEREEMQLIEDYSLAHHKFYVSRKELEELARAEQMASSSESNDEGRFQRKQSDGGSRGGGGGGERDGSSSCRSARIGQQEKSCRSYEGSDGPLCCCY
eukprot:GHVS01095821.1.p1 GENE.GHVS01095821.1~~GHVS01095821.1.p1  ORF type:complete len:271 (-),score=50.17 GHVS01095821.1:325-1137(-)